LERPGFGEHFLLKSGVDAIHVTSRENDWYHYPEMAEAMACIQSMTRGYTRVVTYGSSMGAYAAIRFGGLVGAHAILALSPQFSIDPVVVPWEQRWLECGRRFHGRWEESLPFPAAEEAYVVYDPANQDKRHIGQLAARFRFDPIALRHGGHPVTGFLAEIDLLQELILAVCSKSLDKVSFERRALQRRGQSPQYLINLAATTSRRRRRRRLALMREALRLAPDNPEVVCKLAIELRYARQFEDSLAMHRRSLDIAPGHPNMLLHYSGSLEASGDTVMAMAVMEDLDARTGGTSLYQPRLHRLRARAGLAAPPHANSAGPPRRAQKRPKLWGWLEARPGFRWLSFFT
jgi:hypothetical protein